MTAARLFLVVALLCNLSLAEDTQSMSASASSSSELSASRLAIAPAIALIDGLTTYGFNADIGFKVGAPLYVGLVTGIYTRSETGMLSVSTNNNTNSANVNATARASLIPVMASAIYEFQVSNFFRPYAGIGAGIGIGLAKLSAEYQSRSTSISKTNVYFMGVARVGSDFALSKNVSLYAEPRVGMLDGDFVFNPQVGVAFGL